MERPRRLQGRFVNCRSADERKATQVGDVLPKSDLALNGGVQEISVNSMADVSALAAAYICRSGPADIDADFLAAKSATVLAGSIIDAERFCIESGNGDTMACGLSEDELRAVTSAQVSYQTRLD